MNIMEVPNTKVYIPHGTEQSLIISPTSIPNVGEHPHGTYDIRVIGATRTNYCCRSIIFETKHQTRIKILLLLIFIRDCFIFCLKQ